MKIGLIGAGAIANFLLTEINQKGYGHFQVTDVFVRNKNKYHALEDKFNLKLHTDLESFLRTEIDLVIEVASVTAVKTLLPAILEQKDVLIVSVGALVDQIFMKNLTQIAKNNQRKLYLPSGAIGGLDLLQNAHALKTVDHVTLTTRKPANTLINEELSKEKVVFEGKAEDAIKQFPKNINVAIILSLAGIGIEKTTVRIIADPKLDKNIHQINISGDFGEANFEFKNNPLPLNPKTSYLTALSILGTLERLHQSIKIG